MGTYTKRIQHQNTIITTNAQHESHSSKHWSSKLQNTSQGYSASKLRVILYNHLKWERFSYNNSVSRAAAYQYGHRLEFVLINVTHTSSFSTFWNVAYIDLKHIVMHSAQSGVHTNSNPLEQWLIGFYGFTYKRMYVYIHICTYSMYTYVCAGCIQAVSDTMYRHVYVCHEPSK